jgi:excisionase family DNA binding protein
MTHVGRTGTTTETDTTRLMTYSVEEVAALLGIARGVAYEGVRKGSIPATRVGRRWLIPRRRLHAWLDGAAQATPDGQEVA